MGQTPGPDEVERRASHIAHNARADSHLAASCPCLPVGLLCISPHMSWARGHGGRWPEASTRLQGEECVLQRWTVCEVKYNCQGAKDSVVWHLKVDLSP